MREGNEVKKGGCEGRGEEKGTRVERKKGKEGDERKLQIKDVREGRK